MDFISGHYQEVSIHTGHWVCWLEGHCRSMALLLMCGSNHLPGPPQACVFPMSPQGHAAGLRPHCEDHCSGRLGHPVQLPLRTVPASLPARIPPGSQAERTSGSHRQTGALRAEAGWHWVRRAHERASPTSPQQAQANPGRRPLLA